MNDKITNPDEAASWAQPYGGIDRVEGPDANGTMTYYARDGHNVSVHRDGSFASQGFAPPSGGAPTAPPPAPSGPTNSAMIGASVSAPSTYQPTLVAGPGVQPSVSGGPSAPPPADAAPVASPVAPATPAPIGMTQEQLGAYLQGVARGGDVNNLHFEQGVHQKTVKTVAGSQTVSVPFVRWIDPTTRRIYEYDVNDDGTYTDTKPTVTLPAATAAAETQPPKEEPNPADPTRMRRWNPTTKAWEDAGVNQVEIDRRNKEQAATAHQATQETNAAAVQARGERRLDDAEARAAAVGSRIVVGNVLYEKGADGWKAVTPKPGEIQKGAGPGGTDVQAITDPATGKITFQPIPGAAGPEAPGPSMPELVQGTTEQGLRIYHEALANDPSLTPQQRKDHFAEAVQVANAGVNDANFRERAYESDRSTQVTLATNRATFLQNGLDSALKFVLDMNDKLPQGSDAGAKALMAIMSINMLQLGMSGINDIQTGRQIVPPVIPPGTPPPPTIANPANTANVDKARAEIDQHPANPASPSAQSVSPPAAPAQQQARPAAGPSVTPAGAGSRNMDTQPGQPMFPNPPAPTAGPSTLPPLPATPAADPLLNVRDRTTGTVTQIPASQINGQINTNLDVQDPNTGAWSPMTPVPAAPQMQTGTGQAGSNEAPAEQAPVTPSPTPDYGQPGMSVLRPPDADFTPPAPTPTPVNLPGEAGYDPGQPQGMAPPSQDMGLLAQYQTPPSSPPVQPSQQDFGPDPANHPAVLHSLARTLPPWRIDEATYRKMRAAGVSDEQIAQVPGVAA